MTYEAFEVDPIREGWGQGNRTVDEVGQELAQIYEEVEQRGGRIVAGHTVEADFAPSTGLSRRRAVHFLIAHFDVTAE